jgi:hypothetical protein
METARPRNESASRLLPGMGMMLLRFLGGMGTMLLASILSGFVGGYLISLFRVGPYPPWVPIDKNIGLESAIYGIIAGNLLATAGLIWFSSRRRDWMPLWGGLAVFASELSLLFTAREHPLVDSGTLILASVVGFFVFGVIIALVFHQNPSSRQSRKVEI